jgi:hypothetical protein
LLFFGKIGMEWPPAADLWPSLQHLSTRAYEVAVYCNSAFPYQPYGQNDARFPKQFLDVNMSLTNLVGAEGTTNPWREIFPTMTGAGQYIMREGVPSKTGDHDLDVLGEMSYDLRIRQIDGMELFQLAGFALPYLECACPDHKTLTSMAGNAFSAFATWQ